MNESWWNVFLLALSDINSTVIAPHSSMCSDWRRTCHMPWVKTHSQGQTMMSMSDSLGKKTTWTFDFHLETKANLLGSWFEVKCMLTGKPGNISSLQLAFIIQEKGFIIAKTSQIKKGKIWIFGVSKLLIWHQTLAVHIWQLTFQFLPPGRSKNDNKISCSFEFSS